MPERPGATTRVRVRAVSDGSGVARRDSVVTEEPLEIRIEHAGLVEQVGVTMRTPGDDFALAAGFLYTEGIISGRGDLEQISYCTDDDQRYNTLTALSRVPVALDPVRRRGTISSACGVCGKTSLDAIRARGVAAVPEGPVIDRSVLYALPGRLRAAQAAFEATGGLHAAGLFTTDGRLRLSTEDVGRHNAVDKLIGHLVLDDEPVGDGILLVSGRAGFEIVQKAAVAGIRIVCSVSAPSSLAIDVAAEFGLTLVGFLRDHRANVYTGEQRIR